MRLFRLPVVAALLVTVAGTGYFFSSPGSSTALAGDTYVTSGSSTADTSTAASAVTTTPIKHLVVLFQENVSFDHYFGTYPNAVNVTGEPVFTAAPNTPAVNGLSPSLLTANPNLVQPFRLDRHQAITCDQNHDYTAEQNAFDGGKMDKFVQYTTGSAYSAAQYCPNGIVMGYYDGNTVTGLWNYAQHYAMSDNSFGTVFGPSTPGVLNLVGADTAPAVCGNSAVYKVSVCSPTAAPPTTVGPTTVVGSVTSDADQYYDDWSSGGFGSKNTIAMAGRNIGDLLNAGNLTWGWFNGGFIDKTAKHYDTAVENYLHITPAQDANGATGDYSAHHEGFQYWASTSNPHHLAQSSTAAIGSTDQANHQYDLTAFWAAANAGNLPAVSFLKAPKYQDGHAGYSDPLDEQQYVVDTINRLQSLPSWKSTAVVIAYDDSDGWYDHVPGPIVNRSSTPLDTNPQCTTGTDGTPGRCGYGPRLPLMVVSPYSKTNFVDHTLTDQTSITRFIEDNWANGQRISSQSFDNKAGSLSNMFDFTSPQPADGHRLYLNPVTGAPLTTNLGTSFEVSFDSKNPGQGWVIFGSSCNALVQTATQDTGAGGTSHTVLVTGNDLPGTVGDIGITPGATYYYATLTASSAGNETDNNGGKCYQVTIPKQ